MHPEGYSKKQLKELQKLEKIKSHNLEQKNNMVKWGAVTFVSFLFLVLFVGTIIIAKQRNAPKTTSGTAQFAENGHARMLNKNGTEATNSAVVSQKLVTMVEYGDLQCPACKAYQPVVKSLLAHYPGQLKLIFKNFPLKQIHKNAMAGAIAAEAAGRQGKYFQFVDMAYDKQAEWGELDNPQPIFLNFAKELGLNITQFEKDQKDPKIAKLIDTEENEGIQNGVTGTPSFFINGNKIANPQNLSDFQKIIDTALKAINGNIPSNSTPGKTLPLE